MTVAQGASLTITGKGFTPGKEVRAELHSDPILIGKAPANTSGEVTFTFTIPASVSTGSHTVKLIQDDPKLSAETAITVVAAGQPEEPAPQPQEPGGSDGSKGQNGSTSQDGSKGTDTSKPGSRPADKASLAWTGSTAMWLLGVSLTLALLAGVALRTRQRS